MEGDANSGSAYAIGDDHLLFSLQVAYHVDSFLTVLAGRSSLKIVKIRTNWLRNMERFLNGKYE